MICNVDLRNKYISNKHDTNSGGEPEDCIVNQTIEFPRGLDNFLNIGVVIKCTVSSVDDITPFSLLNYAHKLVIVDK